MRSTECWGYFFSIALLHLIEHPVCDCQICLDERSDNCEGRGFKTYVEAEKSLPPMTSSTKQALVPTHAEAWIRNTTFLLFSDHGGLVKDSAQELLHAGIPRANIFCVVSRYYAHVLQREYALDADLCTPPDWAGAALRFLNRDFARRHAEYAADTATRMRWTVLVDPAFLGEFAAREESRRRLMALAALSLVGVLVVIQSDFRTTRLTTLVFLTLPFALISLWVSPSSTASAITRCWSGLSRPTA